MSRASSMGVSPRRKKILLEVDVLTDAVPADLLPPHSTTASTLKNCRNDL